MIAKPNSDRISVCIECLQPLDMHGFCLKENETMEHHFNCEIAQRYGIAEAIILNHFEYWIEKNKANEKNFFEGTYWTFNSVKAFKEIFPYLTEKKIASALANLKGERLIKTGNFNENKYDRTLWYAITEKGFSILQNGRMEEPEKGNRKPENGEPIPNNNTNIIPNNKESKEEKAKPQNSFDEIFKDYTQNEETIRLLAEWLKVRKSKRAAMTDYSIKLNLNKLDKLAKQSGMSVNNYLKEVIARGWQAFYPVKSYATDNNGQLNETYSKYRRL